MLKKVFFTVVIALVGFSSAVNAQTDSTDLSLYTTPVVLETELDSALYGDGSFELINLDFTVSDTVAFSKVHVELKNVNTSTLLFKEVYTLTDLETEALISAWDVSIPFGNVESINTYTVAIIIEDYDGSLGSTLIKTLNP